MSKQSLYCTDCGKYLEIKTKKEKNGNLIIICDKCGHQHCRHVHNGIISSDRWDSREEKVNTIYGVERNGN